ncbi:MAG: hypothetical protein HW386_1390 [Gammaproteobacteria bacterium]|nr:hypothetical protein [Gammaproteobacteria bacterium]
MPAPASLKQRSQVLQFYGLLALVTYFGVARGGPELNIAGSDLILHWVGYTILLISSRIAHDQHPALWFTGLLAYSILIEIIQYFLPYRTFSLLDILANLAGLCTGSILWLLYQRYHARVATSPIHNNHSDEQG